MKALIFDPADKSWLCFEYPVKVFAAFSIDEVESLLEEVERCQVDDGLIAAGFISYEAAPAFDSALKVYRPQLKDRHTGPEPGARSREPGNSPQYPAAGPSFPLACFGLFREARRMKALELPQENNPCRVSPFSPLMSRDEYKRAFDSVRDHLQAGDCYQVNLTYQLEARYSGDPFQWFYERVQGIDRGYPAYIEYENFIVCSLSPELFFECGTAGTAKDRTTLRMKPMKGTVRNEPGREKELADFLRNDPKNRAENLMIVDMTRNDAGRIALPGSVQVPFLFETEVYPTVIQMTSTVTAETESGLPEILRALFPCASITGAPKRRSMDIIAELEKTPRDMYTGAIGYSAPDGTGRFSVAIRTAHFNLETNTVRYGIGGGIVWDSEAESEYEETLIKAAALKEESGFYVFESLLLDEGKLVLLDRHMKRLASSLRFFGLDRLGQGRAGYEAEQFAEELARRLETAAAGHPTGKWKVRLAVRPEDGPETACELSIDPVPPLPEDYTISLARSRVNSADPFTGHKTSRRYFIEEALRSVAVSEAGSAETSAPADVILVNERGELTETSRGNIALLLSDTLFTPPLSCGALPGTMRAEMLERGELAERVLYEGDYRAAEKIFMLNSVRGMIECRRID